MGKSILLDPTTFEKDFKFPKYLAQCAKLAYNAAVSDQETFEDPENNTTRNVDTVSVYNYNTRQREGVPGFITLYQGMAWEVWHAGVTTRDQEYFRFRILAPLVFGTNPDGSPNDSPMEIGRGQIFVNKQRNGDIVYEMQIKSAADAGKIDMGKQLLAAGMSMDSILQAAGNLTADDLDQQSAGESRRQSGVKLGYV